MRFNAALFIAATWAMWRADSGQPSPSLSPSWNLVWRPSPESLLFTLTRKVSCLLFTA